jgi:RNA polymerase sigma-70 factor, ECF subfamily
MAEAPSLESLMARYIAGEAEAFDALYRETAPRVFAFFMVMTGDKARAEDLCQVTYLKLHRARAGYLRNSPVVPWLMAIARNAFIDEARQRGRSKVRVTQSGELPDRVDPKTTQTPELGLREAIDRAVDALSPGQREAFVLTKHTGLSPRDAARVLGTTETAVKLRVHRAYLALREALAPYRTDEP